MTTMITGTFADREHVDAAVNALVEQQVNPDDISVLVPAPGKPHEVLFMFKTGLIRGGQIGGGVCALIAGLGGLLMALDLVTIPGMAVAVGSPVLTMVKGMVAGGAFGALFGALIGLSVHRHVAELTAEDLRGHRVFVGVPTTATSTENLQHVFEQVAASRVVVRDEPDPRIGQANATQT